MCTTKRSSCRCQKCTSLSSLARENLSRLSMRRTTWSSPLFYSPSIPKSRFVCLLSSKWNAFKRWRFSQMRETKITSAASFSAGPWAHRNVSSSMWELCTTRFRQKKFPNSETGGAPAPRSVFSFRRSSRTSILLSTLIRTSCSSPHLKTSGLISTSSLNTRFVARQPLYIKTIFRSVVWLHESAGISKSLAPILISFFVLAQEWRKSIRVCFWWTWRACVSLFSTQQSQYHSILSSGTKISCFRSTTETRKICMAIRIWLTRRFITIQGRFWIIIFKIIKEN